MRQLVPALTLLVLIAACVSEEEYFSARMIDGFPPPVELNGEVILADQTGLLRLHLADTLGILVTRRDTIYHVFHLENMNQMGAFGTPGEGPGELWAPLWLNHILALDSTVVGYVIDQYRRKWIYIDLIKSMETGSLVTFREIDPPDELPTALNTYHVSEDVTFGMYENRHFEVLDGRRGLFWYYTELDSLIPFEIFNLEVEPYEHLAATNINARLIVISPDGKQAAVLMQHLPMIEIVDLRNRNLERYILQTGLPRGPLSSQAYNDLELTRYYMGVAATDSLLYLLYAGEPVRPSQTATIIQVVTWDGRPHAQYRIPSQYAVSLIDVDSHRRVLYGVSYSTDSIYRFDLPD